MTGHEAKTHLHKAKMSQKQNALFLCLKYQKVHRGGTMLTSFLSLGLKLKFQELCLQLEVEIKVPTLLI